MKKVLLSLFLLPLACLSQTKQRWIDKPKEQWPQIALINNVQFKNGDRYIDPSIDYAGTGFLIDNGKDTLAATAKHILWVAKNRKSKVTLINNDLERWVMKPKGNLTDSVVIDELINEDSTEVLEGNNSTILERDWLIFSVKSASSNIYPLKPRYTPLNLNEKVYILSCAYEDSACKIYEGTVLRKEGMDILIVNNMNGALPGSSGSPVIDTNGYLVGIMSSGTSDSKTGKGVSVAVSTEYLSNVLNKKEGLNTSKQDYGEVIFQTVLREGAERAIQQYVSLTNNPENYYIYNLRSANRNGLRETGERLIELKRFNDAIEILRFNVKVNDGFYINHNILAKAYMLAGKKEEAIRRYRISTTKYDDKEGNEAFKELKILLQ